MPMPVPPLWPIDDFARSLTALSDHTRRAYEHDVQEFVAWRERGACAGPDGLDHRVLRRYLAYLTTRGFSRSSIDYTDAPPLLGQHTAAVLRERLGYDDATIGALASRGVIGVVR